MNKIMKKEGFEKGLVKNNPSSLRLKKATCACSSRFAHHLVNCKRSQLTLFIILALAVVVILFILVYPQIKLLVTGPDPDNYIRKCSEDSVKEAIKSISMQGGSLNPENYLLYQDNKVDYICYTNSYYELCKNQQPLLISHIANEIKNYSRPLIQSCISSIKSQLEKKGNQVSLGALNLDVELTFDKIIVTSNIDIEIKKGESASRYNKFIGNVDSSLYNLAAVSESIINWEARYGDSETTVYMYYYPDIKVEKLKQGDGSKVYILTDRNTGDKFMFATRSLAFPAGYGVEEVMTHST